MSEADIEEAVIVTGASRGLGRELAIGLAGAGYYVYVNFLAKKYRALQTIELAGGGGEVLQGDVGNPADTLRMAELLWQSDRRLAAVINNAGITKDALLVKTTEANWDRTIMTNLTGAFNMTRAFFPLFEKGGGGHIVNISSRSGMRGNHGQSAYSASKAALLAFTRVAAAELAGYNIMVNAVTPGYMATEMGARAGAAMRRARVDSLTGGLFDPSEAARFVLWLIGRSGITGQVFTLDSRPY